MTREPRWRRGALALAFAVLLGVLTPAAASGAEGGEDEGPRDGVVEVGYAEPTELRGGEGWLIDCSRVGELDGVELTCEPESLVLTSQGYDPEWGTHPLLVPQQRGSLELAVTYRVRLEPPPAPEFGTDRIDLPVPVGAQRLIPISALGIVCAVCSADGGAVIEIGEVEMPGVAVGVSPTHLAVRSTDVGDAVIPVTAIDDSGQTSTVELTVSFVEPAEPAPAGPADPAPAASAPIALHTVSPTVDWNLAELVFGDEVVAVCDGDVPAGFSCAEDGTVSYRGERLAQLLFRAVDADGRIAWGSITVDPEAASDGLAAVSWATSAPLVLASPPPEDETDDQPEPLLSAIARMLEGVPAP